MEQHGNIDSKFRRVILAAKRAKQLLKGAKKKVLVEAENPLTVALKEVEEGLINYEEMLAEDAFSINDAPSGADDLEKLFGGGSDVSEVEEEITADSAPAAEADSKEETETNE